MKGKAPSGSRAVTSPKVKAKEIILGREDLYDSKLEQDFYPLHHLKVCRSIKLNNVGENAVFFSSLPVRKYKELLL